MQQLRMLREVSHRSTIAAAADSLGYTPSAVSQQLSSLEKSTGVAVLERVGRNVRLTDAGRELVRHADGLLAGMEAAQVALESVNGAVRGDLNVTVFESVAATLLPQLLTRLSAQYPDLHLRTRQCDPYDALDALVHGDIDLAFTVDYPHAPEPQRDDIIRYTILQDWFRAVLPSDDPIEGSVALADLADRPFICSSPTMSCGRCVVAACREVGFEPDIVHQVDDYPTAMYLVGAGQGVSLISDLGLADPRPGIRIVDVTPPFSRLVQLSYRTASEHRPAIKAVRDTLLQMIADTN